MNRQDASKFAHEKLIELGLSDWHVRISTNNNKWYLGLCSYKDKAIILNGQHIDIHPVSEVRDTILHEIAHALVPDGIDHSAAWKAKALELGASDKKCSVYNLTPDLIDSIRSGATIEYGEETEIVKTSVTEEVKVLKPRITQLKDKCPHCGKDAIQVRESLIVNKSDTEPNKKMIFLQCGHLIVKVISKGTPFHKFISNGNEPRVKNCKHNWLKNQCLVCKEFQPYPFQIEGMRFIEMGLQVNKGALICDEMGLGKTVQATGYVKYHDERGPFLYVVKSGLKFQWFKHLLIWNGVIAQVINTSEDVLLPHFRHYIISYDILVPKTRKLKGKIVQQGFSIDKLDGIKTVILDECQQIKNPDSSRTQQIRRIVANKDVIALSGTPWKNRGSEYFSILNMMAPQKFPSFMKFSNDWVDYYAQGEKWKEGGIRRIPEFREYTKDLIIRREVSEVMKEMPDVNRTMLFCDMDMISKAGYDSEVSKFVEWYNDKIISGEDLNSDNEDGPVIAKLSRMRHIIGLAKIPITLEAVQEYFTETDRKLVIFAQHIDVQTILYQELNKLYGGIIDVFHLTGSQSAMERFEVQEKFNRSKRAFLIASTLSAGEGLNLQTCADAIMHEFQWNPANEDQAAPGRFRRIGQLASIINVIFPTVSGSIDELLRGIIERKRADFHTSMNKGEAIVWSQGDIMKELIEGIVKQHNKNKKKAS